MSGIEGPKGPQAPTQSDANDEVDSAVGTVDPGPGRVPAEAAAVSGPKYTRPGAGARAAKVMASLDNVLSTETIDEIFDTAPQDLEAILEKHVFSLADEMEAIAELAMPENFAEEGDSLVEGREQHFYNIQFGAPKDSAHPDAEEFLRYFRTFNMLPREILNRSKLEANDPKKINMKWLNDDFALAEHEIRLRVRRGGRANEFEFKGENLVLLPANIGGLVNLEELNLGNNKLAFLPVEIAALENLQDLNLYENNFRTIPLIIEKLTSLKKLNIANNSLTVVPAWLEQLNDLAHLQLGNNPINEFELDPHKCRKLNELYFNNSGLHYTEAEKIRDRFLEGDYLKERKCGV